MLLSIIIPALNEERYLPLLLKSIKKQSFKDYEIIIADAGSEDNTVELAVSFGCKVAKGGLPARGRNEGAKIARGKLFLFTDSDNIFLSANFLQNLIKEFKKRDLDLAYFPIYADGGKIDRLVYGAFNLWTKLTQRFLAYSTNSVLIKREIHQKIGGFDEEVKIAEDQEYVWRAKKYGKFGFIETEPVLTSSRRYEREGRIKTYLKYILAGIWMIFFGPVKSNLFNLFKEYWKRPIEK
ncbi:MAG: glycosyltransferase [Patescibacteria group bacterium]|nr:glycosyltransferase [Patescibacteria group bacterium]